MPPPGRDQDEHIAKKKRLRACDQCRRRKVRCYGSETEEDPCSNCATYSYVCTYVGGMEKRYYAIDYVQNLEAEVARLRLLVKELQAKVDARGDSEATTPSLVDEITHSNLSSPASDKGIMVKQEESDDDGHLVECFKCLSIDKQHRHYMGRSSNFTLIKTAIDLKQEVVRNRDSSEEPVAFPSRRPEFWDFSSKFVYQEPPYISFPEPQLMSELLDNYFRRLHRNYPLLHRAIFLKDVASGLHLRDEGFGATVLLVCAVSARFSDNPAVLPPGSTNWHWAGWQWFEQVRTARKLIQLTPARLYDLQIAALASTYIGTSPMSHNNYAIVGHGLRLAQDMGVHRQSTYGPTPTVEGELKKRAFWWLIAVDRGMCAILGRPCSLQDEDIDVDYPIECDDEYWVTDDPKDAFKQPSGKTATVSHFICALKLVRINASVLRNIYSLQASKLLSDPERAQQIVSELDSELNEWVDSIPEHLKYDAPKDDPAFSAQSAQLYAAYYHLRVFIHRPFITWPHKPAPLPFPSLMICTNAARSCIQVLDRHFTRFGFVIFHQHLQLCLFTSAIVLLVHIWSRARAGLVADAANEIEHVNKALHMLKSLENRWNAAGRFWDMLRELMCVIDPGQHDSAPLKRRRDDDPALESNTACSALPTHVHQAFDSAHSDGAADLQHCLPAAAPTSTASFPQADFNFVLPLHTDDLGRLPNGASFDGSNFWQPAGAHSEAGGQQIFNLSALAGGSYPSDPELEALFADLLPAPLYENPFATMAPIIPQHVNYVFNDVAAGAVSAQSGCPANTGMPRLCTHPGAVMDPQLGEAPPSLWNIGQDGPSSGLGPYLTQPMTTSSDNIFTSR